MIRVITNLVPTQNLSLRQKKRRSLHILPAGTTHWWCWTNRKADTSKEMTDYWSECWLWNCESVTILKISFISRRMLNKGGISTHLVNIKGTSFLFPSKDVKTTKKILSYVFPQCKVIFKKYITLHYILHESTNWDSENHNCFFLPIISEILGIDRSVDYHSQTRQGREGDLYSAKIESLTDNVIYQQQQQQQQQHLQ